MKQHNNFLLEFLIIGILFILFYSCSTPITSTFLEGNIEIKSGDSALIYWNFEGATGVQLEGNYRIYNLIDSVYVKPTQSTQYKVTAFQNNKEDLSIFWNVNVSDKSLKQNTKDNNIKTLEVTENKDKKIIYTDNLFEKNINDFTTIGINSNSRNNIDIKFIVNDYQGNYISDLDFISENFSQEVFNNESDIPTLIGSKINSIVEFTSDKNVQNNICICIDNSDIAQNNMTILNVIESFSSNLSVIDNYYLSYFNQNFGGISEITRNMSGDGKFDSDFKYLPLQSGFCALNKSIGQTINYMLSIKKDNNVIILITSSNDNASIVYDENDLISHAKKHNIPIYVIAIGEQTPTYNLSQLANHTGGRLFILEEDNISKLSHYFKLITNSLHKHYRINVDISSVLDAPGVKINLELYKNPNKVLSEKLQYPLYREKMYSEYQALAYFDVNNFDISESFETSIKNLCEVLKSNPNLVAELIGNSTATEGNEEQCRHLSLQRTRIVKQKIIESGVNPEQIRTSVEGSARPLYQFPKFNWQHKYNNRLEIRWLLPEDYPFEIITDIFQSEEEANQSVEQWEDRNYNAYYQRILQNNRPAYRVLIWGYKTENEAIDIAKKTSKEFKKKYYVK